MNKIRCKNITGSRLFRFVPTLLAGLTLWAGVGRIQAQILQLHVPFTNNVGSLTYSTPDGTAGVIGFNMYVNPNTPTGGNLINNNAAAVRAYYPGSLDFTSDLVPAQGTTQPANGSSLAPALVINGSAGLSRLGNNGLITNCFYSWWAKSTTFTGGLQSGQNPRMFVLANGNDNDYAGGGTVGAEIQNAYANTMAFNGTSATGSTPGNVPFPLCSPTVAAQPGQWMFWGFSYDGTNLYVWYGTDTNAPVVIGSGTLNHQSVNLGATSSLNFGNENAKTWDRGFNGWLSDLRFYSFNPSVTGVGSFSAANAAFVSNVWAAGLSPISIASSAAVPPAVSSGSSVLLTVGASSLVGGIPGTANISNVVVNASSISSAPGSSALALAYDSNASDPAFGLWTNSVTVTATSYPVLQSLPVTVQDGASNTLGGAMTVEILGPVIVWDGGGANNTFGAGANWVGGVAPAAGYVLDFAGTTQTSVDMEANYSISGLAFNSGAGSFTITNPPGTVLTVDVGSSIVNNSSSTETLNVPLQLGGAVSVNAASGNIILSLPVGGTGPLTLAGPDTLTLGGTNTYTGNTTIISNGTFTVGPGALLNNGSYGGTIANSGTLNFFGGVPQTNTGVISGAGAINVTGGGPNNGPILTLTAGNTFTGNLTLSNTYVSDTFQNNNLNITGSGIGNPQTVGQVITINSNAVLSLDNSNPLGNGSTIEQGTIVINAGGVFQITAVNGNATVPAIVLNGGTMQAVGSTGGSSQFAALELGSGLTAGGVNASPSLITVVNGGPFAEVNLLVNATSGSSPWTVNPSGINPTGAPDLTVSIPLINSSSTQYTNTGLSKFGAGTLLVNSPGNNYTGPTTINAGTFILGDPGLLAVGTYGAPIINNSLFVCSSTAGQVLSGVISGTGTNAVYGPGANLTLTGLNTYTGPTIIGAGGSLVLSGTGSIANSSSITVSNGGIFNVSGESPQYNLGSSQSLQGTGNISGTIGSSSGSKIFPGTDGTYGTITFNNGLNVGVGASLNLDVGPTYNGANDQIIVGGALTIGSGDFVHIKAPSTSSGLDESGQDYVLVTAASISGSFSQAPAFDVLPTDAGHYSIVTDPINKQVRLHYSSTLSPVITTVTATPSSGILRGSTVFVSATVTPGAGSVTNVSVSLGAVGGGTLGLLPSGTPNVYTNSIVIVPTIAPGPYNLTVFATDTTPLSGAGNLAFTVAASSETWDGLGANQSVDTNANWISGNAPGYVGDSLVFAGTVGLTPVLDQNYTVTAITFSNTAGLFSVTNSSGDFLTLAPGAGLTNNSANTETVSAPIELGGGVNLKSATATGNLALTESVGEVVVGSGSVTNTGGTNILYGTNTYTGNTTISAGTLIIGSNAVSAGSLAGGNYPGAISISNSATFDYFSGQVANFSGVISGSGAFKLGNGGTNNGPIVLLSNNFNFTGNMVITNTYVSLVQANNNNPVTTSVLGNPATAGRTVTISNAFLSFDASGGNELGGGAFAPALGFVVGQGGVMQITSGNCVIGPLTLNGGIVNIAATAGTQYEPFELGGAVTVGGTTASLITNVTDGPGAGLNLTIAATTGNTTFTVAATGATGPDLTVAVPLANSGSEAAGGSTIGLIKAGAGTMALTDPNNSYTGGTTISAGTLILGSAGQLSGGTYSGTVSNSGTFIVSTSAGQTLSGPVYGAGLLEVSGAGVSLTLGAADAYTGKTLVTNSASLVLGPGGSIASSSSITVAANSTFDVSQAASPALGANQSLFGLGTIHTATSGALGSSSGSVIAPSNDGTNAIGRMSVTGGGLAFGVGATAKFALSATYNGVNDSIAVAGALTGAANSIHLSAPSASGNLDISGNDYVLMTGGSLVGGFASTPIWDVAPLNAANYTIISDPNNNNVRLHYSANLPPTAGGSFSPSTALRNDNALLTVLVTNGTSGTISSVVVNAAPLGGLSSVPLAFQSAGVYTTTITIPPTAAPGAESVLVQITDGNGLVDAISVGLTITTSKEIWNGQGAGNQNWDDNANWVSGAAPGYLGDSLIFAGNVETSPVMDQNYTIGSLTFSNMTSSFNITGTAGTTLTLPTAAGITNLSGTQQTLNVPIALKGSLILNSTNTNASLVLPGNISEVTLGAGSITNAGNGTNILEGNNSFTGNITVAGGTFEIGTNGTLAGGIYNGTISLSTGAKFNYFAGTPQTFSATSVITGPTGAPLNFIGGGTNTGQPIVILAGRNTYSGNTYISNIWVSNQRSDSASQDPPFSGIGNVDQAGQTFTVDNDALLSFDIGNELGENNSPDTMTLVLTNGGAFEQTVGNSPIGSLALYGGTVDIQSGGGSGSANAGVELSGTVVAGNATTGPSYIASSTGIGGMNLGVITSAGYQASFTVNPAGVNPGGAPDLTVSAFLGNCGNNNSASGLIKLGAGTLLLSGQNVYTGTTTLSNGVITLGSAETAPTSGPLGASPSTTPGQISFGGGTLQYSSVNQFDYSGGFSTAAGQTIKIDTAGQTIQFATPLISSGGSLTVTDSVGSGVLSLTAAETYSGATTVNGGTLSLGTGGSLANASSVNIGAGGTFDVSHVSPYTLGTAASLTASGTGAKPATLNGSASLGSSPIILNYNGLNPALTVTGGTLTLNGNAFTVNGAPLAPNTYTVIQSSGTIANSGTCSVTGTAIASPNTGSITVSGGQVNLIVSPPAFPTTGTNLTFSVSGRSLTFTWPASYLGSTLQSNSVSIASSGSWFPISGSTIVTNLTLPVGTNGTVFYRLNTP